MGSGVDVPRLAVGFIDMFSGGFSEDPRLA
jgi:hypothetical protein